MFDFLAQFILRYRLNLLLAVALVTAFFAVQIPKLELSYDFAQVVPPNDPEMLFLSEFKQEFGEDGNVLVIGLQDSSLYTPQNFARYRYMSLELQKIRGVEGVLSLPVMPRLVRNDSLRTFEPEPIFTGAPESQAELDSLLQLALDQKIYSRQLINPANGATLMVLTVDMSVIGSPDRQRLMDDLLMVTEPFEEKTGIKLHYAGVPFVRAVMTGKVQQELKLFLVLSVVVTALILFAFFRSVKAVVFPMVVIGVMIVWSLGTLVLFGFKITLLTGLIPPIIVVIGIPNCIYLLNKYHQEFAKTGHQQKSLSHIIRRIGFVTLITNFTTAIGFLVLLSTDIRILKEFGIVAGLNILATFVVSLILIPAIFSYLPPPSARHLRHLESRRLDRILTLFDVLVHRHRYRIMLVTIGVVLVSLLGVWQVQTIAYMVDDIPEESDLKQDLYFFEQNFGGVMPMEIVVDTGRPRGIMNLRTLGQVDSLQQYLASQPELSPPISIINFLKASRQAFYKGSPAFYELPSSRERSFLLPYLQNNSDIGRLSSSFMDSTGQKMRLSLKVADVGSQHMDTLVNLRILPQIRQLFPDSLGVGVQVTGTTLLFIKGNQYLIQNLRSSLLIAIVIIALVMALLFRNGRMILISLVPNMVPLIVTAGLMGFLGIPLKPSTALIFSIAFGISVDDSIHFLAKYRQELFNQKFFVAKAISLSLRETGSSMIYTSIVLFFGFVIFVFSEFGGTVALGMLTSITLLLAMLTNLLLLPSLLLAFDSGKYERDQQALIEHYDEFYVESEDEEIDLKQLRKEPLDQNKPSSGQ
ncbi:efflux RND transporter permease subunit [Cesiribacter andamanensis]|uniref:Putative membrane protein ydgH n=1 Tax=Cesiribacter andamanensis AMV16 TaxID=1279009 RepID=M7NAM5_9BACT|nr:efflux RND transporter permease subunit [Cesiribacter andamanensis]EMR04241.1 Putative membrane protein ydgH [Cesiribacter andamanensis AMV16]